MIIIKSAQEIELMREAGRLLNFVDGQEQERMLVINARTGEFVVDNFDRDGDMYKTGFNVEEYQKILFLHFSLLF